MFLVDAFNSGGFAHQQLGQFLTTFGGHNRLWACHNLRGERHRINASPCSLKGWVASVYKPTKKARVLQAPARVVFCSGV